MQQVNKTCCPLAVLTSCLVAETLLDASTSADSQSEQVDKEASHNDEVGAPN